MSNWLENYDYRITIHWWLFVAAGLIALLITLGIVSVQTMKAASANPAKRLKAE